MQKCKIKVNCCYQTIIYFTASSIYPVYLSLYKLTVSMIYVVYHPNTDLLFPTVIDAYFQRYQVMRCWYERVPATSRTRVCLPTDCD